MTYPFCRRVASALLLCGLAAVASAQPPVSALEKLLIDKRYDAFVPAATAAAAQGDAEAVFLLAKSYHLGLGVEVDLARAAEGYRRAGELGSARAWHNLARLETEAGRPARAEPLYKKALAMGLRMPTLYNLGRLYLDYGNNGFAAQPMIDATHYLAQAYALEPNDDTLSRLIQASALARRYVSRDPAGPEVDAVRAEATKWLELGLAKNLPSAYQNQGAQLYYEGDVAGAIPWFEKAAQRGVPEAAFALGMAYSGAPESGMRGSTRGNAPPRDEALALHWYEVGSRAGHEASTREVARRWRESLHTDRSPTALRALVDRLDASDDPHLQAALAGWRKKAQAELDKRALIAENLQHAGPVPAGPLRIGFCLTDVPGPDGIALTNTSWRIAALRDPVEEAITLPGIAQGRTDAQGCAPLGAAEAGALRQALEAGYTLAWIYGGQATLLTWKPMPMGGQAGLELQPSMVLGPEP